MNFFFFFSNYDFIEPLILIFFCVFFWDDVVEVFFPTVFSSEKLCVCAEAPL